MRTYIVLSQSEKVLFSILHILLQASDGDNVAGLVSRKAYVHWVLVHDLTDGLALGSNQPTVHTMVNAQLLTDLFLLKYKINHAITCSIILIIDWIRIKGIGLL